MSQTLFFEDFVIGSQHSSPKITVTTEMIKEFASRYDPQVFHLDEEAARDTFFQGLAASGWHTAALTMRLLTECSLKPEGGMIGGGIDELKWPTAMRPDDTLHVEVTVRAKRQSRSKPERGFVTIHIDTVTQHGTKVQSMTANILVPVRDPSVLHD